MPRNTTDTTKKISIFRLRKQGYLSGCTSSDTMSWKWNGEPSGSIGFSISLIENKESYSYIRLEYRTRDSSETEWEAHNDEFRLVKVPCHFGGFRWFFKCEQNRNGYYCGKRVALLYMANGYFSCRKCANLSYDSCNEGKKYRGTFFSLLGNREWEYYSSLKRFSYRGKPTRKYRRFLKMSNRLDSAQEVSLYN